MSRSSHKDQLGRLLANETDWAGDRVERDRNPGPLPGQGPWIRVDGVWYTKDATGEIVPMKLRAKTPRRRVKSTDLTPPTV